MNCQRIPVSDIRRSDTLDGQLLLLWLRGRVFAVRLAESLRLNQIVCWLNRRLKTDAR